MKISLLIIFTIVAVVFTCQPAISQEIKWNNSPQKGFVYEISNKEAQKLLTHSRSESITDKLLHTLVDTFDVQKGWTIRPSKGHFIMVSIIGNKLHCEYTCIFPYQVFLLQEYNALALQVLDPEGNVRDDAKVKLAFRRLRIDRESNTYRIENDWVRGNDQIATVELNGFRSVFNIQKHDVPSWYHNYDDDEGPSFYSYMITDKNKYKPNEQVRFKSYSLSHVKSPLRKELTIWLNAYPKRTNIGIISPHRPGSYAGEFRLHDSLKLALDKNYNLQLCEKSGRIVASCSFRYEDYELSGNRLDLKLEKIRQYYPENNQLTITATDVNGLMLKDAKADILVKANTILETFQPLVILPDTIFFSRIDLDPANPTVVDVPCELFQKTNTAYQVLVTMLNSQNQRMESTQMATYYHSNYELDTHFSNDSICFSLLKNNVPMDRVPINLRLNGELNTRQIVLPYKEKLNPAITSFHLENELISRDVALSLLNPELELTGGIQKDSFNIVLRNPQKLEVSWFIYQGSRLLQKGFGEELDYKSLIEDRTQTYYVELLYTFGGQEQVRRRQYEFKEDFLNVSLNIPERIYPGQQVNATISVSDQLGKPVRDVDLTAMSITGKLNYYIPDLPYYGSSSTPRPKRANYSKTDLNKYTTVLDLDYKKWKTGASLDTMLYYQFTYPRLNGFRYTVDIADSTQFTPFIMQKGQAKQIYVIEVDRHPVYYSWTSQPKGYSFYISPIGKHEITLRLYDRVLILDSIAFEKDKKTIVSFDLDNLPFQTKIVELETKLSQTEINRHNQYISGFKVINYHYAYLASKNEFIPLFFGNRQYPYSGSIIAGPIPPGKKTYVENEQLKTTYSHTGGYDYSFEDNIVYKLNASKHLPDNLRDAGFDPMEFINDKVITKKYFIELQDKSQYPDVKWETRTIDIMDTDSRLRIFLPVEKESSGIAALLFENCLTKNIVPPSFNKYYHNPSTYYSFPVGCNSVIVLYSNGTYLRMDSVNLKQNIHVAVDLNADELHPADSLSLFWLSEYSVRPDNYNEPSVAPSSTRTGQFFLQHVAGNLVGTVYDGTTNESLPGATIMIKGTSYGTVADIDGNFTLQLDDYVATIVISFIGYVSKEIEVTRGSVVTAQLEPDILALEEVVVIGYGVSRMSELTGSVAGVSIQNITTPDDVPDTPEDKQDDAIIREAEQRLYQELLTLNSIRSNFSDVGFWEPRLFTDNKGKSSFNITFPDDITRWDAVVYAMNRYLQTGTARKTIRSYKPLMAELNVPQFLTRGDSSLFLGKVLNYTADSIIQGQVQWTGANTDFTKDIRFTQFHTDMLSVKAANTDSITTRYSFTRDDGYLDGEERTVPVVEQGIMRAEGSLSILKNGDEKNVKASENETVHVEILDNQIDIYAQEVDYLLHYRYDCNEQLASKLIGLINHKLLMQYEGKAFKYDGNVNRIINRLLKNQNKEFLWSWWNASGNTSYWMSSHILRALKCAKDAGYNVELNTGNIARKAEYKFDLLNSYYLTDIDLLHALAVWEVDLKYPKYIYMLDSIIVATEDAEMEQVKNNYYGYSYRYSYLKEKLLLQEIRQMKGLDYKRDTLLKYKKEGMLGDVYFSDDKPSRYWYSDETCVNSVAYRIVRRDSLLNQLIVPMQMHFIASRGDGGWNTYQSSDILMTVLPDLLAGGGTKAYTATVKFSGRENKTITDFPYSVELKPGQELNIRKESGLPLYYIQYVNERVTKAKTGVEGFMISTWFSNNSNQLEAGKPVDLIVDVDVKKQSAVEHVMIEVPIPGACSYADKRQPYYGVETHREYYKERTLIFCETLNPGKYTFVIRLLPRFTGKYLVNPAQVSLMYIPVVNANTDMKKMEVHMKTQLPVLWQP